MRIGILGDGQLALMLKQAGVKLGHQVKTLAQVECGKLNSIKVFLEELDTLTFENEFIQTDLLTQALEGISCNIFPSLSNVKTLQNKINQKTLLDKLNIPTSPWREIQSQKKLESEVSESELDEVFKWSQFGYDGKGTLLSPASYYKVTSFLHEPKKLNTTLFLEKKIPFQQEIAIVATRAKDGSFAYYPVMSTIQKNGICTHVYGPSTAFGVSNKVEDQARGFIKKVMDELQYTGTFAMELFLTEQNELFVNEMAPRVHNSGHYSLELNCSQFENHIRAISEMALIQPEITAQYYMRNLIGINPTDTLYKNEPGFFDYGKSPASPGRKMGHVNYSSSRFETNFSDWVKAQIEDSKENPIENKN